MRAQPKLVAGHAIQLRENDANVLRPGGRFHAQQLFDRFAISQRVGDRRHIIHAVHIRIEHRVRAVLGNLLDPAMQVTNHAFEAHHLLAIQPQNDAQHAMGRGMLRPHIDDELVGVEKCLVRRFQIEWRE